MHDKIIDPTAPAIVLLGLNFDNLGPLKIFPNIKPPMSDEGKQIRKNKERLNGEKMKIIKRKQNEKI